MRDIMVWVPGVKKGDVTSSRNGKSKNNDLRRGIK